MINQNPLALLYFGKKRDTGGEGIILGENPAGHCFLLRDLIPVNLFKYITIAKLKICITGNIFGNICF